LAQPATCCVIALLEQNPPLICAQADAEEAFIQVSTAYETLGDEVCGCLKLYEWLCVSPSVRQMQAHLRCLFKLI